MLEPHQFERDVLFTNQWENSMYTIKNAKIEDITCDGNSAYLKTTTNKRYYCLLVKDGRAITKILHSFDDENFYLNQRNNRDYKAIRVDINDVYLIERYNRQNKLLRQIIVQIKPIKTGLQKNYYCLVYNKSEDEQSAEVESLLPHGNAKAFTQPYIRTSPHVLTYIDCLPSQNVNNKEIQDMSLERSGGPYHSKSLSDKPRNIKQIKNRKQQLKSSSKNNK